MNKKLPIGYDNFKEVIEKDLYYPSLTLSQKNIS